MGREISLSEFESLWLADYRRKGPLGLNCVKSGTRSMSTKIKTPQLPFATNPVTPSMYTHHLLPSWLGLSSLFRASYMQSEGARGPQELISTQKAQTLSATS